jgi:catechol 2,3-dioxygenase
MSESFPGSLRTVGEKLQMGPVSLRVADPNRMRWFYREIVGMQVRSEGPPVRLGVEDRTLIELRPTGEEQEHGASRSDRSEDGANSAEPVVGSEEPSEDAPEAPPAGLYHVALRVPSRADLAGVLAHLRAAGWPLRGGSDHGVSEAIYLTDPEQQGLEIYADRPREEWPYRGDELAMGSDPLDVDGLLAEAPASRPEELPPDTAVGHVHLEVSDLETSEAFYAGELGLPATQRSYPGALFLGAGGYHHHVGLNEWGGVRPRKAGEELQGLAEFEFAVPAEALPDGKGIRCVDPDGIPVRIRARG